MRTRLTLILLLPSLLLAAENKQPFPVTVVPLESIWFQPEQSAPASVKPLNQSHLAAEINGRILAIQVKEGAEVKRDDTLVLLDCRDHQSRLKQQQAELERLQNQLGQAQRRLQRARGLATSQNVSEEEIDARETELNTLQAGTSSQHEAIGQQQRNLERCVISAPFDGLVEERLAAEGDLATPGTPLIKLIQLDQSEVEARLRPEATHDLENTEAIFTWRNKEYPVKLARIFSTIDPRAGTRTVRFHFSGPQAPPGASGRLIRRTPQKQVPADFPQKRDDKLGLFILNGGKAHFHLLAGAIEGRPAAVDLPGATQVIDQGRHNLRDGDPVSF